jgi:hypothetical protein
MEAGRSFLRWMWGWIRVVFADCSHSWNAGCLQGIGSAEWLWCDKDVMVLDAIKKVCMFWCSSCLC